MYGLPKNSSVEITFSGQFPVSFISYTLFSYLVILNLYINIYLMHTILQHPMHLHGHNFDVVRAAGSDEYNFVNPVRRDTVNIGINQSVSIVIQSLSLSRK